MAGDSTSLSPNGAPAPSPASPCTGVCAVDPVTQVCRGCTRTLNEITAWFTASPAEKRAILGAVAARRRA